MPVDFENDATLTEAIARLEGAEAAETPIPTEAFVQAEDGSTQQQPAADSNEAGAKTPNNSSTSDTPATADQKPPAPTDKTETKPGEKPPGKVEDKTADGKPKSKFADSAERLDKTWKAVNERKVTLDAQETALKQREQTIVQREQKAAIAEAKSRQKFTPEQYQTAGQNRLRTAETMAIQADGLDRRAELLEGQGKYQEAEALKRQAADLREQSTAERVSAKQMQQMADHLRKNPDPTLEQHKATLENHKRHYLLEAAKKWPDVAVANSPFQKTMATHLQAAAAQGLDPAENPAIFYHVARLTAAEAAAACVPDLEKKLSASEAKVKELEAFTSPGGGRGSAQTQPGETPLTDEQEGELLRQSALTR